MAKICVGKSNGAIYNGSGSCEDSWTGSNDGYYDFRERSVGMQRNVHEQFVGIPTLKRQQFATLTCFKQWAAEKNWHALHEAHYDWWMFPLDEPSSYGFAYTVFEGDIAELNSDAEYVAHYLDGAELLARAWGWDLARRSYLANPDPGQTWQHWPIRLYKATKSLKLFGYDDRFQSFRLYARDLMAKGVSMAYSRDLTWLYQ